MLESAREHTFVKVRTITNNKNSTFIHFPPIRTDIDELTVVWGPVKINWIKIVTALRRTRKRDFQLRGVRGPSTYPLIGLITVANLDRRMKYVDSRAAPAAQFET